MESTHNLTTKSKVVKPRARKPPANKKRPRKMGHIHGGKQEHEIVWGQRWFRSGVDHASGGREAELDLRDASPSAGSPNSNSRTPSVCPSPSTQVTRAPSCSPPIYSTFTDTPSSLTFDATYLTAPAASNRQSPLDHSAVFPPAPQASASDQTWLSSGLADNPSVSYDIFSTPFGQADQTPPESNAESMLLLSPQAIDPFCNYTGAGYNSTPQPTYSHQPLASPISAPSPASSDGWTFSPVRQPTEVAPAVSGYGLALDPPNNMTSALFSSETVPSVSSATHAGRPRTAYSSFHDNTMPIRRVPQTRASGLPAYQLTPNQSRHMSRMSDAHHLSTPSPMRHNRNGPSSTNDYTFPLPPNENDALFYTNPSGYANVASTSMVHPSSANQQYHPFLEYGNRFDSGYSS